MANASTWPVVTAVIIASLISAASTGFLVSDNDVVVPTADEIAAKVNVPASVNVQYNDTDVKNQLTKLSDEVLKDDLKEVKALDLVNEELNSKDFKRALVSFLNNELNLSNSTSTIEDYKDIESIVVTDGTDDVIVSGDSANAELSLKVKYFLDGDTDSDDLESAKVKVELSVDDLDEDEEYEDAEVDSYDSSNFELVKFYDN